MNTIFVKMVQLLSIFIFLVWLCDAQAENTATEINSVSIPIIKEFATRTVGDGMVDIEYLALSSDQKLKHIEMQIFNAPGTLVKELLVPCKEITCSGNAKLPKLPVGSYLVRAKAIDMNSDESAESVDIFTIVDAKWRVAANNASAVHDAQKEAFNPQTVPETMSTSSEIAKKLTTPPSGAASVEPEQNVLQKLTQSPANIDQNRLSSSFSSKPVVLDEKRLPSGFSTRPVIVNEKNYPPGFSTNR